MIKLCHKPNMEDTVRRFDAFWQGEVIDRPLVSVTAPKRGCERTRTGHIVNYRNLLAAREEADFARLLDDFDRFAGQTAYLGESIPFVQLDFGPDMFAACLGAELHCPEDPDINTTWVNPAVTDWSQFKCRLDMSPDGVYQRFLRLMSFAHGYSEGRFLLSVPDTHSNLDALSALRGPQDMCFDLMDYPDEMDEAMHKVRGVYPLYMESVFSAGGMEERGYIGWIPTYSRGRFATVQCDALCLLSPEQGQRYVLPALEEEVSLLDRASYHFDGKEALQHLDGILGIEGIDVIQWVPGAGQPRSIHWMELLKKIQSAGKGLWIFDWTAEEIKAHFKELRPEKLLFSLESATEDEAEQLLEYLTKHM